MPAPPKSYIPITKAAQAVGLKYRRVRQLVDAGEVRAMNVDGIPGDDRVRWLVSVNSLRAYRKRVKNGRAR